MHLTRLMSFGKLTWAGAYKQNHVTAQAVLDAALADPQLVIYAQTEDGWGVRELIVLKMRSQMRSVKGRATTSVGNLSAAENARVAPKTTIMLKVQLPILVTEAVKRAAAGTREDSTQKKTSRKDDIQRMSAIARVPVPRIPSLPGRTDHPVNLSCHTPAAGKQAGSTFSRVQLTRRHEEHETSDVMCDQSDDENGKDNRALANQEH
jgi:hypothetical protein